MHRLLTAVLVAGAVLVLVGPAGGRPGGAGGVVTWKDPANDVRAPGLTRAERNAIDITSVQIGGEEGLGLFGTVTFKGNFQQLAGRGHLKSVAAGLILRPTAGSTNTPAMLLTVGPGKGTVYRKTRSTTVTVVRDDLQLHFFVIGPGFDSVGSVQARVETNLHPAPAPVTHLLDAQSINVFDTGSAADSSTGIPAYGALTCKQLLALIKEYPGFSPAAEGLQNEYHDRCEMPSPTGSYSLTFGEPAVCFVNNGPSTDARFENVILRHIHEGALPPATGTLELKSTSGFDQTLPVVFDSSGKAAPVKFNLTSFGDYTANAVANLSGQSVQASTTFSLNKANDITTC